MLFAPMNTHFKRKAVIFDLDGTLLDTLDDLADSTNTVLKQHGFPTHDREAYRYYVGDGIINLIMRSLPQEHSTADFAKELLPEINTEYGRCLNNRTQPYEGIRELLSELSARSIRLAVLSNKPHHFTTELVRSYFPDVPFDFVFGFREGIPRKPDPSSVLDIVKKLNCLKNEVLYVGDTDTDMKTAAAAGLYAVGISWGFRPIEELADSGANAILEKPMDLLELL
jgi:phosphoglycolate phosphatase